MKQVIQILINYVEGNIDINEFKAIFESNKDLRKLLKKRFDFDYIAYKPYNFNLFDFLISDYNFKKNNWDNIENRYFLYLELKRWLNWFKIPYKDNFEKYKNDYEFILDIQPSWLDITDDQGIFDKIIAEMPQGMSKTKRIQLGKSKIKELFRYDKTYPRWIQNPEWPIIDGKPLVFSHQEKAGNGDERTYYYFYAPETGKQTIITQFY